jgi:hypothetical protein
MMVLNTRQGGMFWPPPLPTLALLTVTAVVELDVDVDEENEVEETAGAPKRLTVTGWPNTDRATSPPVVAGTSRPCVAPAATAMLVMDVVQSGYVIDAEPDADIDPSDAVEIVLVVVLVLVPVVVVALAVFACVWA